MSETRAMTRTRFFKVVRVRLGCGHHADLFTGRYRVSRDLRDLIAKGAVRKGVWCLACGGTDVPVEIVGVFRGE